MHGMNKLMAFVVTQCVRMSGGLKSGGRVVAFGVSG